MSDLQHDLAVAMLRIQDLLEEAELDEHTAIQDAFNALACAIDDEFAGE
jgi:hypothetical protein